MDKALLAILACPICKQGLRYQREKQELHCLLDKIAFPIREDIPVLLIAEGRQLSDEEIPSE